MIIGQLECSEWVGSISWMTYYEQRALLQLISWVQLFTNIHSCMWCDWILLTLIWVKTLSYYGTKPYAALLWYGIIVVSGPQHCHARVLRSTGLPKWLTNHKPHLRDVTALRGHPSTAYGKPARKPNAKDGSLAIFNILNAKDCITYSRMRTTIC